MTDVLKVMIVALLIAPAIVLTVAIWIMGGWTKGWDAMPNPADALLDWCMR